jgi:DNA-binding CsgD family transcriptional regulator
VQDPAAERAFQRWVDIVGDMLLRPHPTMPIQQLLDELYLTFDTEASWAWRDADGTFGFLMHHPIPEWPADGQLELWADEALSLHPLVNWFRATGDLTATTLARVPARAADPRGLQILRHHLLPVGLEQQLSIPYRQTATGTYRAFVLAKGGADFSDADVTVARRIQPLLVLLARQCRVLVGYAACEPATEAADGPAPGPPAASWERTTNGARDRRVSVVEETSLLLGLTGRELAVLRLLADGKTAAAIGRTLGISPRTVHVHLTHVYGKLGVNDRLMAVSVARQIGLLSFGSPTAWTTVVPQPRHPEPVPTSVADVRGQRAVAWRPGLGAIRFDPAP